MFRARVVTVAAIAMIGASITAARAQAAAAAVPERVMLWATDSLEVDVTKDWFDYLIAIATAAGTVGAVLVALYLSIWREHRQRPQLRLAWTPLNPASPDGAAVEVVARNTAGRLVADRVEMRVAVSTTVNGNPAELWPGRRAIGWTDDPEIHVGPKDEPQFISPGGERTWRLAIICRSRDVCEKLPWYVYVDAGTAENVRGIWLTMPLLAPPMFAIQDDRAYRVGISIAGANVDLESYEAELHLRARGSAVELIATQLRRRRRWWRKLRDRGCGEEQVWRVPTTSQSEQENRGPP